MFKQISLFQVSYNSAKFICCANANTSFRTNRKRTVLCGSSSKMAERSVEITVV